MFCYEGEDDLGASGDPSGAAGSRLTCCIIEPVEPPQWVWDYNKLNWKIII